MPEVTAAELIAILAQLHPNAPVMIDLGDYPRDIGGLERIRVQVSEELVFYDSVALVVEPDEEIVEVY